MAASDIVQRVKSHMYGFGVGEGPRIVRAAADASETISAPTISFDLVTNDGAKVSAGDVLSVVGSASAAAAFVMYVLSVSTDTVTCLSSFHGSTAPTTDELDGAVLEVNPLVSEFMVWDKVETIFNAHLWPHIWKYNTRSVTPDLATGQVELNAAVQEIEDAQQEYGGIWEHIPFGIQKHVSTDISSTGVLGEFGAIDGSNIRLVTREKYVSTDTLSQALEELVATGATALLYGATMIQTDLESSTRDNQERANRDKSQALWRDFYVQREALSFDLASDVDWFEIRRG
jgi:hypothetical protein